MFAKCAFSPEEQDLLCPFLKDMDQKELEAQTRQDHSPLTQAEAKVKEQQKLRKNMAWYTRLGENISTLAGSSFFGWGMVTLFPEISIPAGIFYGTVGTLCVHAAIPFRYQYFRSIELSERERKLGIADKRMRRLRKKIFDINTNLVQLRNAPENIQLLKVLDKDQLDVAKTFFENVVNKYQTLRDNCPKAPLKYETGYSNDDRGCRVEVTHTKVYDPEVDDYVYALSSSRNFWDSTYSVAKKDYSTGNMIKTTTTQRNYTNN